MKKAIIVLLLSIAAVGTAAGIPDRNYSYGCANGHFWRWSEGYRIFLMTGILEGLYWSSPDFQRYAANLQNGEREAGLDIFYAEPLNLPIPIAMAMQFQARRLKGESSSEIQNDLVIARRVYSRGVGVTYRDEAPSGGPGVKF